MRCAESPEISTNHPLYVRKPTLACFCLQLAPEHSTSQGNEPVIFVTPGLLTRSSQIPELGESGPYTFGFPCPTALVWDLNFRLFELRIEAVSPWVDTENLGSRNHRRNIFLDAGNLETAMHLPCILQRCGRSRCTTPPEIKLIVDLGISVVAVNEDLRLLKVTKGLERKVG